MVFDNTACRDVTLDIGEKGCGIFFFFANGERGFKIICDRRGEKESYTTLVPRFVINGNQFASETIKHRFLPP